MIWRTPYEFDTKNTGLDALSSKVRDVGLNRPAVGFNDIRGSISLRDLLRERMGSVYEQQIFFSDDERSPLTINDKHRLFEDILNREKFRRNSVSNAQIGEGSSLKGNPLAVKSRNVFDRGPHFEDWSSFGAALASMIGVPGSMIYALAADHPNMAVVYGIGGASLFLTRYSWLKRRRDYALLRRTKMSNDLIAVASTLDTLDASDLNNYDLLVEHLAEVEVIWQRYAVAEEQYITDQFIALKRWEEENSITRESYEEEVERGEGTTFTRVNTFAETVHAHFARKDMYTGFIDATQVFDETKIGYDVMYGSNFSHRDEGAMHHLDRLKQARAVLNENKKPGDQDRRGIFAKLNDIFRPDAREIVLEGTEDPEIMDGDIRSKIEDAQREMLAIKDCVRSFIDGVLTLERSEVQESERSLSGTSIDRLDAARSEARLPDPNKGILEGSKT